MPRRKEPATFFCAESVRTALQRYYFRYNPDATLLTLGAMMGSMNKLKHLPTQQAVSLKVADEVFTFLGFPEALVCDLVPMRRIAGNQYSYI